MPELTHWDRVTPKTTNDLYLLRWVRIQRLIKELVRKKQGVVARARGNRIGTREAPDLLKIIWYRQKQKQKIN